MITILHGIGGSHAYGLNTPSSDEDHVGVISYPTSSFWNLKKPQETVNGHEPYDYAFHELEKFCSLAAKSNPTVLEYVNLDSYIEQEPEWGSRLIAIRKAFPSKNYVFNSYIGYAESQFRKLMSGAGAVFSSGGPQRQGKFQRHCIRLLDQGLDLYTTGDLHLRVADPEYYRWVTDLSTDRIAEEFTRKWSLFTDATSALPDKPDFDTINGYLYDYRKAHV